MTQVLVVDDSDTLRQMIRTMLEPEGYAVAEANDGVEALAALRASAEPRVVLLDYYMPNLDGGDVLKAVLADDAAPMKCEYIVISSSVGTFPDDFIDLVRHLSVRILTKPFSKTVLVSAVAQAAARLNLPGDEPTPLAPEGEQP
ncbi:MAG TPA: response regulator [Ktedonobacterales bacterium]|jgi:CheY-like chemotaxis protein